jgi:hypothetical protein
LDPAWTESFIAIRSAFPTQLPRRSESLHNLLAGHVVACDPEQLRDGALGLSVSVVA